MERLPWLVMGLASRWTRSLAGAAIASAIIWYLFPMVPALRPPLPRLLAIAAVFAICLAVNGVLGWRRQRHGRALAAGIAGDDRRDPGETEAEAAAEVAQLRERMRHALSRLQRRGRMRLYEQPWFVLIGPPGSGKTTALLNSGLHFPLARDDDENALGGVGGTRLCDWWFAEEAVLIDTAGRYTTQDSDAAVDRAGWHGFLDLLRRTRPRQPINGVVVVLSLTGIAAAAPDARAAHARSVRRRIDEINERLQIRVPVYVMFSKADQLSGFDAYFDDLDAAGRAQVWGMTFPVDAGVEAFASEFRALLARLDERLVERLQAERAADRRALIGGFPLQVASLYQPLVDFMTQAFSGSRLDPAPFLRGVYLSSATQDGTPIDRLTGMLARSFGIDQKRAPSLRPAAGKSYFVSRLVREVILGEALLVSTSPRRLRRRHILRMAGFASVGLATLAGGLLLWQADQANRAELLHDDEAMAAYGQRLSGEVLDPVASGDLSQVAPILDASASLVPVGHASSSRWFGLSQAAKLAQGGRLAYQHALQRILLPRLLWRLEQQMRDPQANPEFLYEATRIYLMLGGEGPLDPALVRAWLGSDWQTRYPGTLNADLRVRLLDHLGALLASPLPPSVLDGGLVEAARARFGQVTPAARVYGRIRAEADADAIPAWSPLASLGPAGAQAFARLSGKPLDEGVPGFLTGAGYRDALLVDLPATTHAVAGESWVLGHAAEIPTEGTAVAALEQAVISLWTADARQAWDGLLGDLALASFGGHDHAIQQLYVLASPQSPIRDLLVAITGSLSLEGPARDKPGLDKPGKPKTVPASLPAEAAPAPAAAAAAFEQHYRPLFDLVDDGNPPPLDNLVHLINALDQQLAAGAPVVAATAQAVGDPAQLLLAEADRQPVPVSRWLGQIASIGTDTLDTQAHSAAAASFAAADGPAEVCRSVAGGHFPFDPASADDAPIGDFTRLFAPGGVFDMYFQSMIKPFADTRGAVWRPQAVGGVSAPVDRAALASFQRAAAIRDAFFPASGQPMVSFTIRPDTMNSAKATLALGGASVASSAGNPLSLTWPGADGIASASLRPAAAGMPAIEESGPWALFRLLGKGRLRPAGSPETYRLSFVIGHDTVDFLLKAGSTHNPFGRDLLGGFRCPVIR